MCSSVLGRQDGSHSEAMSVVGIMGDGYHVLGGIIRYGVDAGNLFLANVIDAQNLWFCFVQSPAFLTIQVFYDLFRQSDGSARGSIQLVDVVGFHHIHVILVEPVHNFCQIRVYGTEDGNSYAEVGTPEKRLALFGAHAFYVLTVLWYPARAATHYFHVMLESLQEIIISYMRGSELNGDIGRSKSRAVKVLLVVNVDDANNFVTTRKGNLFYHVPHFAISYECYFHVILDISRAKVLLFA